MSDLVNMKATKAIKQTMPGLYSVLRQIYWMSRRQKPLTKLLGAKWQRSRDLIEVYITYKCNLKCINCDVSSRQAQSDEKMTIGQINKFIGESINAGVKWKKIRVMGGEPTLHSDILEILNLLLNYKETYSPDTRIQLITNGFGKVVNNILSQVPEKIEIENSNKKTANQRFSAFNIAPQDSISYKFADYSNACPVTSHCGIGLTPYGYYCCGIAGSIDRVFGFNISRKKIPAFDDSMIDHLQVFCKLCGHFMSNNTVEKEIMSPTWEKAYEKYKKKKPDMDKY